VPEYFVNRNEAVFFNTSLQAPTGTAESKQLMRSNAAKTAHAKARRERMCKYLQLHLSRQDCIYFNSTNSHLAGFNFNNLHPQSFSFFNLYSSLGTGRSHTRRFIRSHTDRWTQQQITPHSEELETDEIKEHCVHTSNRSGDTADSDSIGSEIVVSDPSTISISTGKRIPNSATGSASQVSHNREGQLLNRGHRTLDRCPSSSAISLHLNHYFDADDVDPFHTYPSGFPPEVVTSCTTYS
jgi:hypothetical protein